MGSLRGEEGGQPRILVFLGKSQFAPVIPPE